jgi:NleD-like pathogen effector protein (putative zinc metallopeptidase)
VAPPATGTGNGTDVTVQFNPSLTLPNTSDPSNPMPNDAVLFHEMNHGHHDMTATYDGSPKPGWTTHEEQNTISTGNPSEATYLREQGYPWQRADHDTTWVPNP